MWSLVLRWKDAKYGDIAEQLKEHASEELAHVSRGGYHRKSTISEGIQR